MEIAKTALLAFTITIGIILISAGVVFVFSLCDQYLDTNGKILAALVFIAITSTIGITAALHAPLED